MSRDVEPRRHADRAAQFMPFAALTGYYDLVRERERVSEPRREPSEEEAAAMMGAKGFTIWRRVTFPHIRWALLYGIILCAARAIGEFGAVYAVSKARGKTFTLPLEIDALYMAGSVDSITQAFAVSSLLVLLAVVMLILKQIVEHRGKREQ